MRLATWLYDGRKAAGIVVGDELHTLPDGLTVLDLVTAGLASALELGATAASAPPVAALRDVQLLVPFEPPTVRDFVSFEEHVEGVMRAISNETVIAPEWYEYPTFYFTNPYAVIATGDDVAVPPGCAVFDFELEVAAVIGLEGRDIDPAGAGRHIFGYTIFNDWSARDLQGHEMKVNLGPAKGKDSASTLGPWIVTADEVEPKRDGDGFLSLGMTAEVNGVEVGRDLLSNMGWPFEDLVAYASRGTVVRPGDLLGSGTCGNGGCLAELWGRRGRQDPPPLQPGDVVTLTVEGIGKVTNTVTAGVAPRPISPARARPRARPS